MFTRTIRERREIRSCFWGLAIALVGAVGAPASLLANEAPIVTRFTATPASVAPGELTTLTVEAYDPDCGAPPATCTTGCGLTVRSDLTFWCDDLAACPPTPIRFESVDNGVTGSPYTATAQWRAPATEGNVTVRVSLSDSASFFVCGDRQTTTAELVVPVSLVINQPPVVEELTASPLQMLPGQTSVLTCLASDPDGDPLTYSWSADAGTVTPGDPGDATFTADAPALANVTCTATDSLGAPGSATVRISVTGALAERALVPPLAAPQRVGVDSFGALFVADQDSGGIAVIHLGNGELVYRLPLPDVHAVAVDWADDLLVGRDQGAQVLDRHGNLLQALDPGASLGEVADVAVDLANLRYAALYRRSARVVLFNAGGDVFSAFGSNGDGAGELRSPGGLAFTPAGDVAVADTGHGLIKIFNPTGTLLSSFGGLGGGIGEFIHLDDVAVDANGIVYASDAFQDWVQAFDPDGTPREVLGTYGGAVGEFKTPTGVVPADAFGRLVVASTNSSSLQIFRLVDAATEPPLPAPALSKDELFFGNLPVGATSAPRKVTLTNTGAAPLGVRGARTEGDFAHTDDCPESLDSGASCTFSVTFAPTATGARVGVLSLDTSAGAPHPKVLLSGNGFLPASMLLSTRSLSFPDQPVDTSSPPGSVLVTNAGGIPLSLTSIGTAGPFSATSDCPAMLAAGASCTIRVTFKPPYVQDILSGSVILSSNALGSPHSIALEGRGTGLLLAAAPGALDFGQQIVHLGRVSKTLTVTNTGSDFVELGSVLLEGGGTEDFTVTNDLCSGAQLWIGQVCSLEITFAPTRRGEISAQLRLPSSALTSPNTVELKGTALGQEALAIPTLSEWALILMALLLGLAAVMSLRRRSAALLLVALLAGAGAARAQTAPHWVSSSFDIGCTTQCHTPHHAPGDQLSAAATNANLCQACHNPSGLASDLAINNADAAVRGVSGSSHAFGVPVVNPQLDTQAPLDTQMQLRLPGGNLICSTCHNQHRAESGFGGDSRVGRAKQTTALGSTGSVTSGGTFTGPEGIWYLVEIVATGSDTTARFCFSKDNGLSWFPTGCNPPGTTSPNLTANGASPVALDSGVTVSFAAGSYTLGERWEFSAAWAFLRAALDVAGAGSAICRDCHRAWVMDHTAVETWDGTFKSHPTGVALNASGAGFDRAVPLDGNGAEQGGPGADGNPSNDLNFDGLGHVQCLTCHAVHFVDSNTQTLDDR